MTGTIERVITRQEENEDVHSDLNRRTQESPLLLILIFSLGLLGYNIEGQGVAASLKAHIFQDQGKIPEFLENWQTSVFVVNIKNKFAHSLFVKKQNRSSRMSLHTPLEHLVNNLSLSVEKRQNPYERMRSQETSWQSHYEPKESIPFGPRSLRVRKKIRINPETWCFVKRVSHTIRYCQWSDA